MTTVTYQGKTLTINGSLPEIGKPLPNARLVDESLNEITTQSFKGKPHLILTVPSVDTNVCSQEGQKINQLIAEKSLDLPVVMISRDLPFGQKRWCSEKTIKDLQLLSDFKYHEVGKLWGIEIQEWGLLARCCFLLDKEGRVKALELVDEITEQPDYEKLLFLCGKSRG